MTLPRRAALLAAPALLGTAPRAGLAQGAYPNRPVRLVVPFPPGNMADLIGRTMAEEMAARHGASLVVDNRVGASGAIGIQAVLAAPRDGHTLMLSSNSPLVVNPAVMRQQPFDVQRDLVPIALIGQTAFLVVVPPDFPARTLAEALALFRAAPPGRYSVANNGTGTFGHLVAEQLLRATGTHLEHVSYRGSAQALLDISQGRVHMMMDAMTSSLPQVQGGRVRALAVLGNRRSPLAPEIPTLAESGVPELAPLEAMAWTGLLAPAGAPQEAIAWWVRTLPALLSDPVFARRLAAQNVEAAPPGPPSDLGDRIARELARFTAVARDAGIEVSQ